MKSCLSIINQGMLVILAIIVFFFADWDSDQEIPAEITPLEEIEYYPPPTLVADQVEIGPDNWIGRLKESMKPCATEKSELIEACTYLAIRDRVVPLISPANLGYFNLGQIADIYDYIYANWGYVNDPMQDDRVFPASYSFEHMRGDCDDFSALLASMLLSIGGEVRINYVCNVEACHAYVEVNLGQADMYEIDPYLRRRYQLTSGHKINANRDHEGNWWLNLDYSCPHPGGEYFPHDYGRRFYLIQNYCEEF